MNKTVRRLFKWIGYPVFTLVVFIVALYMSLPYDKIKQLIEDKLSADPSMTVTIGELGPSPLIGLSAERVMIRMAPKQKQPAPPPSPGKEEDQANKPQVIILEQVKVKSGLMALLSGKIDVSFEVEGLDGTLEGRYRAVNKKGWSIKTEIKGVNLQELPMLSETIGLPVTGRFSGEVDLKVPKSINSAAGSVKIECVECSIGDGKKKLKIPGNAFMAAGITIPRINLGKLGGKIKVDKGTLVMQKFGSKSKDFELSLEGSLSLRKPMGFSTAQAYLRFKIDPAFKKKHVTFELLEGQLTRGKRADGFFGMLITGILKNLKVKPSKLGPGRGGPGAQPPAGGNPGMQRFRTFPARGAG